jgi:hypothetical protein
LFADLVTTPTGQSAIIGVGDGIVLEIANGAVVIILVFGYVDRFTGTVEFPLEQPGWGISFN